MTTTQQIITIAVVVLGTMTTRFLPFIIFSADSTPDFVRFLGRVLPNAVIGLLVIYSLKDSIGGINHCIPELIALVFIFILHKWKKNTHFMIYDTDQMGTAYRGKKYIVYGARQMDHDKNLARIDIGNCQFWRVEGITTVIDGV